MDSHKHSTPTLSLGGNLGGHKLNPPTLYIGNTYETSAGERIKLVRIDNPGTHYETMVDEQGRHYYSRDHGRIVGRLTGSSQADPGNIVFPEPPEQDEQTLTAAYMQGADEAKEATYEAIIRWIKCQCIDIPTTGPMLANALRHVGLPYVLGYKPDLKPEPELNLKKPRPELPKLTLGVTVEDGQAVMCVVQSNPDGSVTVVYQGACPAGQSVTLRLAPGDRHAD